MAMDPEERPRHSADVATLDVGGPAPFGGGHQQQQQQQQQQEQLRLDWASGRMLRSLRLQAVCGAVSCVDESPTAAASPGVSLLRNDKGSGADAGNEATSPHRKANRTRGNLSRSLSRQPSRSGTEPDFIRFDTTSGESPTPSPGRVPCVRARQHSSVAATGSAVPFMTAAQAAGSARGDVMQMAAASPAAAAANYAAHAAAAAAAAHPAAPVAAAGQFAADAADVAAAVHRGTDVHAPMAAPPAFDPNDLAAMNARLAAGLASLPPPPPSSNEPRRSGSDASGTCRQGCSNDTDGGGTASDGGGGGSRKRRERSPEDGCRLRGGGDAMKGNGIGGFGGSPDGGGGGSSDGDSGPQPAARPMKVQRIAVGMSTTDEPAAGCALVRDEDEGTSTRHSPLDQRHGGAQGAEPQLRLPPGAEGRPLPDVQVFRGYWGLDDVRRRRDALFVFGDNDARQGRGGQAVIRGEPNAIGLATKRIPSHVATAYYRDEDFEANAAKISGGVARILDALLQGRRPDADAHPGPSTLSRGAGAAAAPAGAILPAPAAAAAAAAADADGGGKHAGRPDTADAAAHDGSGGGGRRNDGDCQGRRFAAPGRLPYAALVVPADGFGTGRARLRTDAPRTFAFLKRQVTQLLELLRPGCSAELDW